MSKEQTYLTDLTDEQWELLRHLLPKRKRGKPGRPRSVEQRAIIDAIFYILRTGCQWRLVAPASPPRGHIPIHVYRHRLSRISGNILNTPHRRAQLQCEPR